jgi:hypothetical protein
MWDRCYIAWEISGAPMAKSTPLQDCSRTSMATTPSFPTSFTPDLEYGGKLYEDVPSQLKEWFDTDSSMGRARKETQW